MRLESVELFIAGMPNPPSILRLFTAAGGAFASDSSGAWPALQGGYIELVQTVGIADPVNGYDLATGNGEAPITLMGCPSSTMRAPAALISKILGPRD